VKISQRVRAEEMDNMAIRETEDAQDTPPPPPRQEKKGRESEDPGGGRGVGDSRIRGGQR